MMPPLVTMNASVDVLLPQTSTKASRVPGVALTKLEPFHFKMVPRLSAAQTTLAEAPRTTLKYSCDEVPVTPAVVQLVPSKCSIVPHWHATQRSVEALPQIETMSRF